MSTATLDAPDTRVATAAAPNTPAQMAFLEDSTSFGRWLDDLPEEAVCGHANLTGHCPLARYLRAHNPPTMVIVRTSHYVVGLHGAPLPPWAIRFVYWVDSHPTQHAITAGAARRALEVLR